MPTMNYSCLYLSRCGRINFVVKLQRFVTERGIRVRKAWARFIAKVWFLHCNIIMVEQKTAITRERNQNRNPHNQFSRLHILHAHVKNIWPEMPQSSENYIIYTLLSV